MFGEEVPVEIGDISTEELMLMHIAGEASTEVMIEAAERLRRIRESGQ